MNQTQSTSVSFGGVAAVLLSGLFAWLKISNVAPFATWEWIWVFAPLWIGFAIFAVLIGGFLLIAFVIFILDESIKKSEAKKKFGPTSKNSRFR